MGKKAIPYREGEPPPSDRHVRVQLTDKEGNDKGVVWILPEDMKYPPIRHEDIDDLLPVLRWQWRHLESFKQILGCRTFEDWELGFMRDTHPGREIGAWTMATYALLEFAHRQPAADKATVFAALVHLMNGRDDLVKPKTVVRQLKKLVSNPPHVLCRVENFTLHGRLKTGHKHLR